MEVRKDFGKRMAALAQELPEKAVGNLLLALMPRRAASTRSANPVQKTADVWMDTKGNVWTRPPTDGLVTKTRSTRAPRGFVRYEVVDEAGYFAHKRGSWRRIRTEAAIKADPKTSHSAQNWLRENYPTYADRTIPWTRLVQDGVIRII